MRHTFVKHLHRMNCVIHLKKEMAKSEAKQKIYAPPVDNSFGLEQSRGTVKTFFVFH